MKLKLAMGVLGLSTSLLISGLTANAATEKVVEEISTDTNSEEETKLQEYNDFLGYLETNGYNAVYNFANLTYFSPKNYYPKLGTADKTLKSSTLRDLEVSSKTYKAEKGTHLRMGFHFNYGLDDEYMSGERNKRIKQVINNNISIKVTKPDGGAVYVPIKKGLDGEHTNQPNRYYVNYALNSVGTYKVDFYNSKGKLKNHFKYVIYKSGVPTLKTNKFTKERIKGKDYMVVTSKAKEAGVEYKVTYKKYNSSKEIVLANYSSKNTSVKHTFPSKGKYTYSTYVKYKNSTKAIKYTKTITVK